MSLIAIFIASLLGSPHCAGMCGGFVGLYSSKTDRPLPSHIGYNTGRLLTYSLLGLLAGALGSTANFAGELIGLQKVAGILAGVLLLYWGLSGLYKGQGLSLGTGGSGLWSRLLAPLHKKLLSDDKDANWVKRSFFLGALSTFLPCGWLYAFAAVAAASGSALLGAFVMMVFWTGTLPVMASLGGILRVLGSKGRTLAPRITASLFIVAGLFSLFGHFQMMKGHDKSSHNHAVHIGHH